MTRRHNVLMCVAIAVLLPALAAARDVPGKEFSKCHAYDTPAERLACYDALADRFGEKPPKPSKVPKSGWILNTERSKIDDSETVTLMLKADSPITGWPNKTVTPTLMLRCKEGRTTAYIVTGMSGNPELGKHDEITGLIRFDKEKAFDDVKLFESTDKTALFFDYPEQWIGWMLGHNVMLFQFTPFNSSPTMTTFRIKGLDAVVRKVTTPCVWDPEVYRPKPEQNTESASPGEDAAP